MLPTTISSAFMIKVKGNDPFNGCTVFHLEKAIPKHTVSKVTKPKKATRSNSRINSRTITKHDTHPSIVNRRDIALFFLLGSKIKVLNLASIDNTFTVHLK